ncbi:MAG: FKBP-type peptidyl-prolyl cis-trans isomerase [Ignavibacteria bacterium]|nr:FKBP-type peptidyl-prolyl cis-trans isomerase [Ignavibacteria bacterium]
MYNKKNRLIIIIFTLIALAGCSKGGKEITTASGLKYTEIKEGSGTTATHGKKVMVHYVGTLENGKVFDSSTDKNQPLSFTLGSGEMIQGFDEGILNMKVGGRRKLVIPPNLAWGSDGAQGVIPPNATVIFDIELLDVK